MAAVSSTTSKTPVIIKCVIDGNSGVGKSSILLRYCENTFSDDFITTIGVDFRIKKLEQNDTEIKLQIWDRGGRERFKKLQSAFYRGAHLILAIFAVDDARSFEHIHEHLTEIQDHRPENSVVVVVANKIDVPDSLRVVTPDMGRAFAESRGCPYYEVSAKTGENVDVIFQDFVTRFLANPPSDTPHIPPSSPAPAPWCSLQ
eukprot:TRINITY_DN6793_c0_g1_i4.p1 TRINITY_DN6793_c0_g1~~TRINITY_DN6793_c0_g1_i4.p1  ORF type:complete len:202 (-),score=11.40 TRINITY_DN6793_c0_g1_i4:58-663(-)